MIRLTSREVEYIFGTQPARLERILNHNEDVYRAIATASGTALQRARQIFGRQRLRNLSTRVQNPRFRVSGQKARQIKEFFQRGIISGDDSDVVALIEEAGLGRFLESDHLVEQRFIDEIRAGNISFSRRASVISLGRDTDRIHDITSVAVPKNEIIYYRIARGNQVPGFQLAGLYPHTGPGSKTTRMAQFIPVGSEAAHSVADIVNAHLWVIIQEQGLHRSYRGAILEDIASALETGINANRRLSSEARRIIGNDLTYGSILNHLRGWNFPTMDTFSPINWPRYKEIEMPVTL